MNLQRFDSRSRTEASLDFKSLMMAEEIYQQIELLWVSKLTKVL